MRMNSPVSMSNATSVTASTVRRFTATRFVIRRRFRISQPKQVIAFTFLPQRSEFSPLPSLWRLGPEGNGKLERPNSAGLALSARRSRG